MKKSYLVVYVKGKEPEGGWMSFSPDVLRCISAGDDLQDIRAHMTEALEGHLHWMSNDGDILPEPHVNHIDFDPDIWNGVDYYVVEKLTVSVPDTATFSVTAEEAVLA